MSAEYSFHYISGPLDNAMLEDGAVIMHGDQELCVRDGVMGVFDRIRFMINDEFCWGFCSPSQIVVLAAVKIGQTLDVRFEYEFERVFYVNKTRASSGVPNSGYLQDAPHVVVDGIDGVPLDRPNPKELCIVSSFQPHSRRTESRLPFLFYFRVFGTMKGDQEYPVWRVLLSEAIRHLLTGQPHLALLYAAFSLESFIDQGLSAKLTPSGVGEAYIDHILRAGERSFELQALNHRGLSKKEVNRVDDKLNRTIFTPRNSLAHGQARGSEITADTAAIAVRTAVEFMWDWSRAARPWLLHRVKSLDEDLIDDNLIRACRGDT